MSLPLNMHAARTALNQDEKLRQWAEGWLKDKERAANATMTDEELAKHLQAQRLIPVLAAFLLRGDDGSRSRVPQTHGAFSLVDMLASGPARSKGLDHALTQQLFVWLREDDHFHLKLTMANVMMPF